MSGTLGVAVLGYAGIASAHGERGTLVFDLERLNELRVYLGEGAARGLADVLVTDQDHPYGGRWWPPVISWAASTPSSTSSRSSFAASQVRAARWSGPPFADGLASARICDALLASVETGRRIPLV